jgi:hypothetical protein
MSLAFTPLQKKDELQVLLKRLLTGPQELHWELGTIRQSRRDVVGIRDVTERAQRETS